MQFLQQLYTLLDGKRTYITAFVAGVDVAGTILGWWPEDTLRTKVEAVFGLYYLRAGMAKGK